MAVRESAFVYLVFGVLNSGRRQILLDLIDAGLESTDRAVVMLAENEPADPADAKLPRVSRWTWNDSIIAAAVPVDVTHVFFVTDGRGSPVDQAEAFKVWLDGQGLKLARALSVIDCQLAEKNPPLLAWYEACVHFSDVVLLNRREGVENKWLTGFLTHFKKQFYPCIFETVKGGRVKNPALLLDPEARRMTHVFDEEQDWVVTNSDGEEIDEDDEVAEDEELEAKPEEDPYFVRRSEGGRRLKEIPDVRKFLGGAEDVPPAPDSP